MAKGSGGRLVAAEFRLAIESLCGGFPGSIDAMRAYLQSPALAARVPAEVREAFLAGERFEGLDEPVGSVVRTGFRRNPAGELWIGAWQLKACLQQAVEAQYAPKTAPSIYQMSRAVKWNVEVLPHELVLLDATEPEELEIAQIIAHPRNESIKVPSLRVRQVIKSCRVAGHMLVLQRGAGELVVEELEELLTTAGQFVGLGTDRGYGHGRFTVERFAWQGQATSAQRAALPGQDEPNRKGIRAERLPPEVPAEA